ncbi:hypothetical protein AMATHDRAFT_139626 [Amanita thiersii Skay4041]|uniref:Pentacotripeptide-repeat region of PRORP domain-containing protein n=1 Tax=Amanita thiersii Skay4041 TaxID=703135 RepID=A0A2A9NNL2_9AGAR|nr:hypothetical protein AMATHDRAFT_139626 [Amanita thiersii Skay4041]
MGVHTGSDREAAPPKGEIGSIRRRCLEVLERSFIPEEAWDAYVTLCNLVPEDRGLFDGRFIPFAHRHRLCRLLSSNKPKTHPHFLRILSVLAAIRGARGKIHLHEWNILIDHAGQGWRRPGFDDWETAFSFYNDMTTGRPPGSTLMEPNIEGDINHVVKPDTYTYTILLNIAVSTMRLSAMRQAADIIHAAKLSPNKVTHLTMVKHSTLMKQLHGVRSTLLRMQDAGLKLGLDGINACMWAYGRNGQLDIVAMIYRLLRHNTIPEDNVEEQDGISTVTRFLEDEEYITIAPDIKPDQATYVLMIQVMAYHGNLSATMHVFMEMLTYLHMSPNDGIEESKDDSTIIVDYELMNATFRAIFLGFARHGIPRVKSRKQLSSQQKLANPPNQPNWTLANLKTVFDTFTSVSPDLVPSRSTLHWILSAFEKASGSDESLLRTVWKKLDDKYGMCWVAPTNRLDRWRTRLFPDTVAETDLTQDATFVVDYDPEEDAFLL